MIFLARYLPKTDFGILTLGLNFIGFFIPALGFGSGHGMLRFGAQKTGEEKRKIFQYSNRTGVFNQAIISIIVIISAYFIYQNIFIVFQISALMSIRLFGLFFLEQAKTEFRASFQNKKYAQLEMFTTFLALILGVAFTLLWGIWGYIISLCIFPFSVFFFIKFDFKKNNLPKIFRKEFWNFSVVSVLTTIVFMWIFLIDVFFVGQYFSEEETALYKVSTLIPMNLIFIAQAYTQTTYPEMCKNHDNYAYLKNTIFSYMKLFIPTSLILVILGYIISDNIMVIFGKNYTNSNILKIMFLQMASCILFRIPFGNLLGAMGEMKASLIIGIGILLGNCVLSVTYLPHSTPFAEAVISLICITLGGIASCTYFFIKLNKLKK